MQQYYLRAGTVHQLAGRLIERCTARPGSHVEAVMKKLRARDIGDNFTEINRQIHILPAQQATFQEDPVRLLKIFWYRQEMGYDLSPEAKEIIRMRDLLSHMLAEDTGQTQEKVAHDTDRDFIMTAEEAVTYGVIDEVITARAVAPLEAIGAA